MPTTPKMALPYPALTATPDVPFDLQRLAERVEATVPMATPAKAGKRLHWQAYAAATTDATGKVTYTHGAGFTPSGVLAICSNPSGNFGYVWGVDGLTATQFTVRFGQANGDAALANATSPTIFALVCE